MNENEFDLTARAWLEDGPIRMSDHALLSALEEIHATRQRRAVGPAWRATPGSIFARVAIAALLVVAVGLLAVNVVSRQPDGSSVGGPPTPSSTADPTPSPSPSPSPAHAIDFPNLTTTFVSPRNGFSVKHPDRVALTPAEQLLGFSKQVDDGFDVVETGLAAVFKGASTTEFPDGDSTDQRVDEYLSGDNVLPGGCGVPRSQQAEITIDGQSGRISRCPNRIEATVIAGGRLYLFILLHDRSDARAVFDAFAATIDLTPETAIDYPGLTTTFVSPTNGFSFGYLDRGGLEPAKELWDPVTQPRPDSSGVYDYPFDRVETALGAYFKGASTVIPDGVSIDAWVDEYVSPGCAPRSQQAEITIDGQPGRISESRPD
ncbi:MAG: hypothetical protein HYX54_10150 [Chloroflexi bacterium]|nr:hypothetical protein [Chloroflexota bacterium]